MVYKTQVSSNHILSNFINVFKKMYKNTAKLMGDNQNNFTSAHKKSKRNLR